MKKMISILAFLLILSLSLYPSTSFGADGLLTGTGDWNAMGPTDLNWSVGWDGTSPYVHYSYTFTVAHHDISHFSLELSDGFSSSDISNVLINGVAGVYNTNYTIGSFTGGSVPYNTMPGDMYGIKFSIPSGNLSATIEFDSTRLPEWGDFYARCGVRVEHTYDPSNPLWKQWNSAWNDGFASGETAGAGNDPVVLAGSGSYNDHLLVPDSVAAGSGAGAFSYSGTLAVVPEPVSSILFVFGATLLAGRQFMKRKK